MPALKKIVELKVHTTKMLQEIDDEISEKLKQISRLKSEVEDLTAQKEILRQVMEKIGSVDSEDRPVVESLAQQTPSSSPAAAQQKVSVSEQALSKPPAANAELTSKPVSRIEAQALVQPSRAFTEAVKPPVQTTPQDAVKAAAAAGASDESKEAKQLTITKKPSNGEKRWESISVNSSEYARYSVGKSSIELEFKFNVPVDSKYVKGFILDKYLQKLKEDGMIKAKRGELPPEKCFAFDVKTGGNGEIGAIYITNIAQEQLQDLLNKIKWFVASEVRDLKAKGKIT